MYDLETSYRKRKIQVGSLFLYQIGSLSRNQLWISLAAAKNLLSVGSQRPAQLLKHRCNCQYPEFSTPYS